MRHPIYSGLLLMILGTAVFFGDIGGFVLLAAGIAAFWSRAREEEVLMERHFGGAYATYRTRVKALIPFVL